MFSGNTELMEISMKFGITRITSGLFVSLAISFWVPVVVAQSTVVIGLEPSRAERNIDQNGMATKGRFRGKPCSRQHQKSAKDWKAYREISECMREINNNAGWGSYGLGLLAVIGAEGMGDTRRDLENGLSRLDMAAHKGNPEAQRMLAMIYSDYWGMEQTSPIATQERADAGIDYRKYLNPDAARYWAGQLANNPEKSFDDELWLSDANRLIQNLEDRLAEQKATKERREKEGWSAYQKRTKTLLEQVMNYSDLGDMNGTEKRYWVASKDDACLLSVVDPRNKATDEGRTAAEIDPNFGTVKKISKINVRNLNETGWRLNRRFIEGNRFIGTKGQWYFEITADELLFLTPVTQLDGNRLRKAWGLAFEKCPGQKSAF